MKNKDCRDCGRFPCDAMKGDPRGCDRDYYAKSIPQPHGCDSWIEHTKLKWFMEVRYTDGTKRNSTIPMIEPSDLGKWVGWLEWTNGESAGKCVKEIVLLPEEKKVFVDSHGMNSLGLAIEIHEKKIKEVK